MLKKSSQHEMGSHFNRSSHINSKIVCACQDLLLPRFSMGWIYFDAHSLAHLKVIEELLPADLQKQPRTQMPTDVWAATFHLTTVTAASSNPQHMLAFCQNRSAREGQTLQGSLAAWEPTWTAELQTMLGVTASVMPAALRFSCHLLFSASPLSRIACTGN